jgi:hypothetical protein
LEAVVALKFMALFLLMFAFASVAGAQTPFDGRWTAEVVRPAPNPSQNLTIMLKSDSGKISGSIRGADPGETPIDWGFVKGDLITFKTKMTVANTLQTMVYVGRINGDQIAFGRRPEDLAVGQLVEFTAKKAQ